jgi:hypothetical protein
VNLTLVLEDVEMPPDQFLGMVIAKRFSLVFRATVGLPKQVGLLNMKSDQTTLWIELTGGDSPFGA